jgi:hypothetical protein
MTSRTSSELTSKVVQDQSLNSAWTSFHDVTIKVDPAVFSAKYPDYEEYGDKSSRDWTFSYLGEVFTVYDWKETSLYDDRLPSPHEYWSQPTVTLHIGSRLGAAQETEFKEALLSSLAQG